MGESYSTCLQDYEEIEECSPQEKQIRYHYHSILSTCIPVLTCNNEDNSTYRTLDDCITACTTTGE